MKLFAVIAGVIALGLLGWFIVGMLEQERVPAENGEQISEYRLSVNETDPFKGPRDAQVTVITVGSFTCPACKNQALALDQLAAQYPADVKVVWKDLPDNEEHSITAAVAARCAQQQSRFWDYHDALFLKQDIVVDISFFVAWARDLGLNEEAFQRCLTDRAPQSLVAISAGEALQTNIESIPFTQINDGPILRGYQSYPVLKDMVEELLKDPS